MECPVCNTKRPEGASECSCGHVFDSSHPPDALAAGTDLLNGRYRIETVLGRGGFGITYRAWAEGLGEEVAIKEFLPSDTRLCARSTRGAAVVTGSARAEFERAREQFRKEAGLLRKLRHPGVVGCIDRIEENGTDYLVMDLVQGQTLAEWRQNGNPDRSRILALYERILEAVEAVHDAGLTHRDLNPRNIMVGANGQPVLIDFGLARLSTGQGTTTVAHSDGYTALEQYDPYCPPDRKLDVYSLGAVLYCLLTGEDPPGAMSRLQGRGLRWPEGLDATLRQAAEQALALKAEERLGEVALLREALRPDRPGPKADEEPGDTGVPRETLPADNRTPETKTWFKGIRQFFKTARGQPGPKAASRPVASRFGDDRTVHICPVTELEFAKIPAGAFEMGDVWGDGHGNEQPVHWVEIPEFQLARTVVTQGMWERVMGDNPAEGYGAAFIGADKPVVGVRWEDAQAFIRRLNAMVPEGQYRLPGEAEWEYAARSGGHHHKWPGTSKKSELEQYAWFSEGLDDSHIHPVAKKQPNGLGLYDMAGNVFEWCQDRWHDSYEGAPGDGSAWQAGVNEARVLRGGSWLCEPDRLRSAYRNRNTPDNRFINVGFRLARIPY